MAMAVKIFSSSRDDQKILPQYHVIDDVIDNDKNSHKSAIYLKQIVQFSNSGFHVNAHFKSFQLMYHTIYFADVCLFCDAISRFFQVLPQPLC